MSTEAKTARKDPSTLLYLDDVWKPVESYDRFDNIVQVRNYEEFVHYLQTHPMPDAVSLDHDLHLEHYPAAADWHEWSETHSPSYFLKGIPYHEYKEKTGMDCARYIIDNRLPLKHWFVHSRNEFGSRNIEALLKEYAPLGYDRSLADIPFKSEEQEVWKGRLRGGFKLPENLPTNVAQEAGKMLGEVSPEACGSSKVVEGWWIETHTLGCRDAADEPRQDWWDSHWKIYDEYSSDGVSVVEGDPSDGKFVTMTPQKKKEKTAAEPVNNVHYTVMDLKPGKTAAAALPSITFNEQLYHVGTMDPKRKQEGSLEGSGLSVTTHPEEWRQIARLGDEVWQLTKEGKDDRFLDFHRLTKSMQMEMAKWGEAQGLVERKPTWRVKWFDEEDGMNQWSDFDNQEDADLEARDLDASVSKIEGGGFHPTGKLKALTGNPHADSTVAIDLLATIYADDVLSYDGVWWSDILNVTGLSAPRGVIFLSRLPEWTVRKTSGSVPKKGTGEKWDGLKHARLRMGWLRITGDQYSNQEPFFDKPWGELTDEQRSWMERTAGEVDQPGYNHKMASGVRGPQEQAIFKVVKTLGEGGVGSLIVGGMAVQEYGYPRYTTDIDLSVSDFSKAKKVLLENGYRSLGGIMVQDPEFKDDIDHIDLMQGGKTATGGEGIPMPIPQGVNTFPKFCDLETLLDLKIECYSKAYASGARLDGEKDEVDVYKIVLRQGLARDFMQGRAGEAKYERMWDEIHAPPPNGPGKTADHIVSPGTVPGKRTDDVGEKWNSLKNPYFRFGWLRTTEFDAGQGHDPFFNKQWEELSNQQQAKVAAWAKRVSQPDFDHKEAELIRKASGGKAEAIRKVVMLLGTGGVGSIIVGGIAVQEHGYPRNTVDTDLSVSDFNRAKEILLKNGYQEIESHKLLDPEFDEQIDLVQGGQPVMMGDVPMPVPSRVNTTPEFCDLATLLDLKIAAFLANVAMSKDMGVPVVRGQDRVDVHKLMQNNNPPRTLLEGKVHQEEYEHIWDIIQGRKEGKKLSAKEMLYEEDPEDLLGFHETRKKHADHIVSPGTVPGNKGWSYDDPLPDRHSDFFEKVENPHSQQPLRASANEDMVLWAVWDGNAFIERTSTLWHERWFDNLNHTWPAFKHNPIPTGGPRFDRIPRGRALVDHDKKTVDLYTDAASPDDRFMYESRAGIMDFDFAPEPVIAEIKKRLHLQDYQFIDNVGSMDKVAASEGMALREVKVLPASSEWTDRQGMMHFHYPISISRPGQPDEKGTVAIAIGPDPSVAEITWIGGPVGAGFRKLNLGVGGFRSVVRQLKSYHPSIQRVTGTRVSGADPGHVMEHAASVFGSGTWEELLRNGGWISKDGSPLPMKDSTDMHGEAAMFYGLAKSSDEGDLEEEGSYGDDIDRAENEALKGGHVRVDLDAGQFSLQVHNIRRSRSLLYKSLMKMPYEGKVFIETGLNNDLNWWKEFSSSEEAAEWLTTKMDRPKKKTRVDLENEAGKLQIEFLERQIPGGLGENYRSPKIGRMKCPLLNPKTAMIPRPRGTIGPLSLFSNVTKPSELPSMEDFKAKHGRDPVWVPRYSLLRERMSALADPAILYRAVKLESPNNIDFRGFGIYWTWDEHAAVPYNADLANAQEAGFDPERVQQAPEDICVHGRRVPFSSVDWGQTVWANLQQPDEKEVTLKDGSPVRVTGWKRRGS